MLVSQILASARACSTTPTYRSPLHSARVIRLCEQFLTIYGDEDVFVVRAPGRLNILGEHVDYVSYLPTSSIPCASAEYDMLMMLSVDTSGYISGASTLAGMAPFKVSFEDLPSPTDPLNVDGADVDATWVQALARIGTPPHTWANYIIGAVAHARFTSPGEIDCGFKFVVDSRIPSGGGASSSSALTCLGGYAIRLANRVAIDPRHLALSCSKAEWYIGTRGGALDHLTICLSQRNRVLFLSYSDMHVEPLQLPTAGYAWVTFFTHKAEKGNELLIEYNERAAVSRILIPAIIEAWSDSDHEKWVGWNSALNRLRGGDGTALNEISEVLESLDEQVELNHVRHRFPDAFAAIAQSFPALVKDHMPRPLKVRDRARHHIGEVCRTFAARELLSDGAATTTPHEVMARLGSLVSQSHDSLRDYYGVSTPQVEQLIDVLRRDPRVLGARIMGAGFGGNVLAMIKKEDVMGVINEVTRDVYAGSSEVAASNIRASSPGDGIAVVPSLDLPSRIVAYNSRFAVLDCQTPTSPRNMRCGTTYGSVEALLAATCRDRDAINELLDGMVTEATQLMQQIQPIIVAAGKGSRARLSGLEMPKAIAPIFDIPSISFVYDRVVDAFPNCRAPITVVSDEILPQVQEALGSRPHQVAIQSIALGTGDAVLCAENLLTEHEGYSVVVWGTQPVITPETYRRTATVAALFPDYEMIVPTAFKVNPYAPLSRKEDGQVDQSVETHLQKAEKQLFGEDNIGVFMVKTPTMLSLLRGLRTELFDGATATYRRKGGELGFPNETITALAGRNSGVFAAAIADFRESQGIKEKSHLAECEAMITQMRNRSER